METVSTIFAFVMMLAVLGAVSAGASFALHHLARAVPQKKRIVIAALIGAFLPLSLPMLIVLTEGFYDELIIVPFALLVMGLVGALVVGFPVALWLTRRLEGSGEPS